jgi:hypothetical protein
LNPSRCRCRKATSVTGQFGLSEFPLLSGALGLANPIKIRRCLLKQPPGLIEHEASFIVRLQRLKVLHGLGVFPQFR